MTKLTVHGSSISQLTNSVSCTFVVYSSRKNVCMCLHVIAICLSSPEVSQQKLLT